MLLRRIKKLAFYVKDVENYIASIMTNEISCVILGIRKEKSGRKPTRKGNNDDEHNFSI